MIKIKQRGNFLHAERFLAKATGIDLFVRMRLNHYGRKGVEALAEATPVRTGETAASWRYEVEKTGTGWSLTWINDHTNNGVNIALILQFGHGTGTGGYVQGIDYINPALQSVFQGFADDVWKEVQSA